MLQWIDSVPLYHIFESYNFTMSDSLFLEHIRRRENNLHSISGVRTTMYDNAIGSTNIMGRKCL